jgi:DNA repair exonuclease SbcCD nuclease subunit
MVKFSHIADCHIGGWRNELMKQLSIINFEFSINKSIEEKVDFIIIAGDLFNTALPGIEYIKEATRILNNAKKQNIPIYLIPGSHDYSPTGKTILDVLENADLIKNVMKYNIENEKYKLNFIKDNNTNVLLAGVYGRSGGLEKSFFENINYEELENEKYKNNFKIFLFHTTINQLKDQSTKFLSGENIEILPKGFDYYAGGHVHIRNKILNKTLGKQSYALYPGPTMPNNFEELNRLKHGTFIIYDNNIIKEIKILTKEIVSIILNFKNKSANEIESEIINKINNLEIKNKILLIKISGIISHGKISDINFQKINELIKNKEPYYSMKNTINLKNQSFETQELKEELNDSIEKQIIKNHLNQFNLPNNINEEFLTNNLIKILSNEKQDGEKQKDFENRLIEDIEHLFNQANKQNLIKTQ